VHPGAISNLTTRAVEIGACGLRACSPGVEAAGFCLEWRRDMATQTHGLFASTLADVPWHTCLKADVCLDMKLTSRTSLDACMAHAWFMLWTYTS
jgi:hypothetical protein